MATGLFVHAVAGVHKTHADPGAFGEFRMLGGGVRAGREVGRLDDKSAAGLHGVARVGGEIDEDLMDLARIADGGAESGIEGAGEGDVFAEEEPQHIGSVRNDVVQIAGLEVDDLAASEGE